MTVSGLVEFLLSQIAEDEAVARAAVGDQWRPGTLPGHVDRVVPADYITLGDVAVGAPSTAEHIIRHDPARVLAECEAKRALVELHRATLGAEVHQNGRWDAEAGVMVACRYWYCASCDHDRDYGFIGGPNEGCETLRILAQPYAVHPDFDPGWLT